MLIELSYQKATKSKKKKIEDRQKMEDRWKERQIDKIDRQTDIPIIIYCSIVIIFKVIRKNKTNWWQVVEYNLVQFTVLYKKRKKVS